jgi:hypothetical protein
MAHGHKICLHLPADHNCAESLENGRHSPL